jgi:hypothetical protein
MYTRLDGFLPISPSPFDILIFGNFPVWRLKTTQPDWQKQKKEQKSMFVYFKPGTRPRICHIVTSLPKAPGDVEDYVTISVNVADDGPSVRNTQVPSQKKKLRKESTKKRSTKKKKKTPPTRLPHPEATQPVAFREINTLGKFLYKLVPLTQGT